MAQEFGERGRKPSERRKNKQMPDAILRNHEGNDGGSKTPKEIFEKQEAQESMRPLSPRDALRTSWEKIHQRIHEGTSRLYRVNRTGRDNYGLSDGSATITHVIRIAELEEDTESLVQIGDQITSDIEEGIIRPVSVAQIFVANALFRASSLGNAAAYEKLTQFLHEDMQDGKTNVMEGIIDVCAEQGRVPDALLEQYVPDAEKKAQLKLDYYKKATEKGKAPTETAARYRDDVTEQLLQTDELGPGFIWDNIHTLFSAHDSLQNKRRVFEHFERTFPPQVDNLMANRMFSFLESVLATPEIVSPEEVNGLEQFATETTGRLIEIGDDPFAAHMRNGKVQVAALRYHGVSVDALVEKIENNVSELLRLTTLPDGQEATEEGQFALEMRDAYLGQFIRSYVEVGEFDMAHILIEKITNDEEYINNLLAAIEHVETEEALERFTPDELRMATNEPLQILFNEKHVLMEKDLPTMIAFAKERFTDNRFSPLLEKIVEESYAQSPMAGKEVLAGVVTRLKEQNAKDLFIPWIGRMQTDNGDNTGWKVLLDYADGFSDPSENLAEHARLAAHAAEIIQKDDNE